MEGVGRAQQAVNSTNSAEMPITPRPAMAIHGTGALRYQKEVRLEVWAKESPT